MDPVSAAAVVTTAAKAVATGALGEMGKHVYHVASSSFKDYAERPSDKVDDEASEPPPSCKLGQLPWPLSGLSYFKEVEQHCQYDMVLDVTSLEDVLDCEKGWALKIESVKARARLAEVSTIKVGIMGVYNRGKTTVTNLLAGRKAEIGNLVHTKGLSTVLSTNVAFLDTAGQNQPFQFDDEQQGQKKDIVKTQERYADEGNKRLLTDLFMQDMVLALSDVVLVVVNQLTLEDQRYVRVLEKKVKEFEANMGTEKALVVVHNMKDVESKDDMNELIGRDILKGFGCKARVFQSGTGDKSSYWTSSTAVSHCVIARFDTPAGKEMNEPTKNFLINLFQGKATTKTGDLGKNLLERIDDYVRTTLFHYFDCLPKEACQLMQKVTKSDGGSKQELALFIQASSEECQPRLRKNAQVADWQVIWGAKYDLDYECVVYQDTSHQPGTVEVTIDVPGVFPGAPPVHKEMEHNRFVRRVAWTESSSGAVIVEVIARLVTRSGNGPCVEVYVNRHDSPGEDGVVKSRPSSKRGVVNLVVPKEELKNDAFSDAKIHMKANGTLIVEFSVDGFTEEQAVRGAKEPLGLSSGASSTTDAVPDVALTSPPVSQTSTQPPAGKPPAGKKWGFHS
jgi:hypothetical protein